MTTILASFMLTLCFALLLTPLTRWFGVKFGAIDFPEKRKIHTTPTPRTGGLAIFLSFMMVVALVEIWGRYVAVIVPFDRRFYFFLVGALIAFATGTVDDFHRLKPGIKLFFQIVAASVAYSGGLEIEKIGLVTSSIPMHFFSYLITVFWFLLIINAINLVDGMDGLAGGITVFACLMVTILCILRNDTFPAILFASVTGGTLGFLRYNFKPATIFLGDGGSYFLGYTIAGLSLMATAKAEMGAILLIPILGLGVPVFDTLIAPVRRFVRGKKMFVPDADHVHHKLRQIGLTTSKVVWLLYGISFCLCVLAIVIVNLRDEQTGFFLVFVGIGAIFFIRKLGYFSYFNTGKVLGWVKDLGDEAGISLERRSFLNLQMEIKESENFEELWYNITRATKMLEFEKAELYLNKPSKGDGAWTQPAMADSENQNDRRSIRFSKASVTMRKVGADKKWISPYFEEAGAHASRRLFRVELPLLMLKNRFLGTLVLTKDLNENTLGHYTLKRVEHLRRVITDTMDTLES